MSRLETSIRSLLRPSDEIKLVLECVTLKENVVQDPSAAGDYAWRQRRVVAIVIHKDELTGWEEGSVFVLKSKEIYRIFPIYGPHFSITMAQLNLEGPDPKQPRSAFKVTIHPGHTLFGSEPLDLVTFDVPGLKNIAAECKRLKELSEIVPEATSPTGAYNWLEPYATDTIYIPSCSSLCYTSWVIAYFGTVTSTFPDLRDICKPLHTRLSSTTAGIPSDDTGDDLTLIRDHWARIRARIQCRKGRARLNLRLGTFNVNGKTPSQDLAAWVQGSTAGRTTETEDASTVSSLLAVKEISPFSIGEIVKDPFDSQEIMASQSSTTLSTAAASANTTHSPLPIVSSASFFAGSINTASTFTLSSNTTDTQYDASTLASTDVASVAPENVLSLESPEVPVVPVSPGDSEIRPKDPDLLVLGFEELDLSTEALLYSTSTAREDAWIMAVFAALGKKADKYEKLCSKQLVGMLIIIFVKKTLRSCFSNIMSASAGSGIMGLLGNKGGVAIRLTFTPPVSSLDALDLAPNPVIDGANNCHHGIENLGSTTLTFAVTHLAAFDEMAEKRNADFHDLSKRLTFSSSALSDPGSGTGVDGDKKDSDDRQSVKSSESTNSGGTATSVTVPEKLGVFESDALFWIVGRYIDHLLPKNRLISQSLDLNYRIDLPDADVRELLSSDSWKDKLDILLYYDQLKTAMRTNRAFDIFFEHEISHLPTYRFGSGLAADSLGYDTKRKPAFTDRILYAFSPLTAQVSQSSYEAQRSITFSDHRPLSADFTVDVDLYDKHQLHATVTNLFRQVQSIDEVQARVKTKLSHSSIDFGDLFYKREQTRRFTFHNCGKVPLAFSFIPAEMHSGHFPEWLSTSHMTGLLLPDEVVEITLTAFVNNATASRLNLGSCNLNHTLILHTLMAKDHFISVTAKYHYTCFANRLSRLVRLPGPIRKMQSQNDLMSEDRAINAPREIMRLVKWLMSCAQPAVRGHHLRALPLFTDKVQEDLFIADADFEIVDDIREHLDTGHEFPYSHETKERTISLAFGATLVEILNSLPECMIPVELHGKCAGVSSRDEAFEILDLLPQETVNVWISLTAFLHYFVHKESLAADADKISATFVPVFFGILRDDMPSRTVTPLRFQSFIKHFIE
ncbi:hypothetical protein D9757_002587 [Collybiopsis confluens]|uniref:Inositol polyphosphate-related phosphatase domain-containing protein n=1 Tax=Collybiopsis confluens TaxID=2823264 RepID=A0A8H5MED6_9AGAR|nr:hypothetical protein D9757_002587 [Collybiopsis confluens]